MHVFNVVVAGIRTPEPISSLEQSMPEVYDELLRNINLLEQNYHDMLDIEFTVEEGKLFMLQVIDKLCTIEDISLTLTTFTHILINIYTHILYN